MSDEFPFKDTKEISVNGHSLCVYINKIYGVEEGDLAVMKITSAEDPRRWIYQTKNVVSINGSFGVYIDKRWGFRKGEIVHLELSLRKNCDTGVSDKKGDQEVP